jgi:hypothetical protein
VSFSLEEVSRGIKDKMFERQMQMSFVSRTEDRQ